MSKNILALDLGYGSIKVAYRTALGQLRYQKLITAIGEVHKTENFDIKDVNIYEYESQLYYIGPNALRLPSKDIIDIVDYNKFKLVSPIIISYYLNLIQAGENITFDTIVVGLSLVYANNSADYLEYLKNKLNLKVIVLPQGISSKFAIERYGLDPTDDSQITNVKFNDYIGVDIGFNTIDVFSVIGGKSSISATKGYKGDGVIKVAKELSNDVEHNLRIELSIQDYKNVLETGFLYHRGNNFDLSAKIQEYFVEYLIKLIDTVERDYSKAINKVDRLIMVGGGANLIQKYINDDKLQTHVDKKYSGDFLRIPKIPEFYNVLGYFTKVENDFQS